MGKSKNAGKKPGEAAAARKRHLQRQNRQDALNRLAAGETVSIMAYTEDGYRQFTARPVDPSEGLDGKTVLTLREGKIWATYYYAKDGKEVHVSGGQHVPAGKIFGVVEEGA